MRKILGIIAILAMSIGVTSCNSSIDEDLTTVPEMVTVSLGYSVDDNTTRANANSLYSQLYEKVLSGDLVAESYKLKFTEKTTGETFNLLGEWDASTQVSIKAGSYRVTGTSTAYGEGIQDRCSIKFDTDVVVSSRTSKLTLRAEYDSFLFIFDKNVVKDAYISYLTSSSNLIERHFFEFNGFLYGFSSKLYNPQNDSYQYLTINYNNDKNVQMTSSKLNVKNGEYYVFDEYPASNSGSSGSSTLNYIWQTPSFTIDKMSYGKL